MKIAIGVCEKINGICSTMGCFKALNKREKSFSIYENEDLELMSFFTCDVCSNSSNENLINIAEKLEQEGVKRVHFGICIVKCKMERMKELKSVFEKHNIEIIEGSH